MDRLRPASSTARRPHPPSRTPRCPDRPSRPRARGTGRRGAVGGPEKRETRKRGCQTRAGLPRTPPAPRSAPGPRSAPRPGRAGEAPAQTSAPSGPASAAPVSPRPADPHLRPSSLQSRQLSPASLRRFRRETRRAAAVTNPGRTGAGAGGAGSTRRKCAAAILAYGGPSAEVRARALGSTAACVVLPGIPAATHRGSGSRRERAAGHRGGLVSPSCAQARRRGHLAVRMPPMRHVAAGRCRPGAPPPTLDAASHGLRPARCRVSRARRGPGLAAGRRAAGRRHLAVRREPRGWLPRPAAVSPRALPSGRSRPGLGAARRGPEPGGGAAARGPRW